MYKIILILKKLRLKNVEEEYHWQALKLIKQL